MKAHGSTKIEQFERDKVATLQPAHQLRKTIYKPEKISPQGLSTEAIFSTQLINNSLLKAASLNATTLYIEPEERVVRIRFRIGSELIEELIPENHGFELISFLNLATQTKIESDDLAPETIIQASMKGTEYELSLLPLTDFGGYQNLTIKLRKSLKFALTLDELEIPAITLSHIRKCLHSKPALFLICSENSHDASITRHAILQELNTPYRKILSIEGAQCHHLPRVTQISLSNQQERLKDQAETLLLHEADVISLNETHEQSLLKSLIEIAPDLTSVIGTVKANSAISGIKRFIRGNNLNIQFAKKLSGILTLQSVLKACSHCKSVHKTSDYEANWVKNNFPGYDFSNRCFVEGEGCEKCQNTGFFGQRVLYEFIAINEGMRNSIVDADLSNFATELALRDQFESLKQKAFKHALNGDIPLSQALRIR